MSLKKCKQQRTTSGCIYTFMSLVDSAVNEQTFCTYFKHLPFLFFLANHLPFKLWWFYLLFLSPVEEEDSFSRAVSISVLRITTSVP